MIKILSICGSPVERSSTEILLREIAGSIMANVRSDRARHTLVRLNDLDFAPCQSCGEAPTPMWCFLDDDLTHIYKELAGCDCLLFGSPIYFDSVSAQAKAFIDRCNCFRPADFENKDPRHDFIKLIHRKRPGAIILVGGEQGWFEGARRCIAGFFKWIEVVNEGVLKFQPVSFERAGEAADNARVLKEARQLGGRLARLLDKRYAKS